MRGLSLFSAALAVTPLLLLGACGYSPQVVAQHPNSIEIEWPTNSSAGADAQDLGKDYCAASGRQALMVMENWHGDTNTARFECR